MLNLARELNSVAANNLRRNVVISLRRFHLFVPHFYNGLDEDWCQTIFQHMNLIFQDLIRNFPADDEGDVLLLQYKSEWQSRSGLFGFIQLADSICSKSWVAILATVTMGYIFSPSASVWNQITSHENTSFRLSFMTNFSHFFEWLPLGKGSMVTTLASSITQLKAFLQIDSKYFQKSLSSERINFLCLVLGQSVNQSIFLTLSQIF